MNKQKKSVGAWILTIVIFGLIIAGGIVPMLMWQNYIVGGIFLGVGLILLIIYIAKYNKMVRYRNKVNEALSLIDIYLKNRFDLIPNLVNIVKGYAKHEKETFEETTRLRNLAINATSEEEKLNYSNQLVPKMKDIVMIAEDYPKLQAEKLFKSLMEQLVDIEDHIVSARRIYDSNVNLYNSEIEIFPNNIVSGMFGFGREKMFKIDAGETIVPSVKM